MKTIDPERGLLSSMEVEEDVEGERKGTASKRGKRVGRFLASCSELSLFFFSFPGKGKKKVLFRLLVFFFFPNQFQMTSCEGERKRQEKSLAAVCTRESDGRGGQRARLARRELDLNALLGRG